MTHNIKQIKMDYQNIKVPESLKQKVESSIEQAKSDVEKDTVTNRSEGKKSCIFRVWTARLCIGVAAAVLALAILVNMNASVACAMEKIPMLGAIVRVINFRAYLSQDGKMEAKVRIPNVQVENQEGEVMESPTKNLNDNIQAYTDEIIAAYEEDVRAAGGEGVQAVDLDYEVVTDNEKLFSLQFHQTVTMADSSQSERIYHIDKASGEMITLKDLFQEGADYKTSISKNIKEQMKAQMERDDSKIYWLDSEIEEDNFETIADDVDFYISDSGKLTIVFDEYEVAPGYMGVVSFEIPTDAVADMVKEGYLTV